MRALAKRKKARTLAYYEHRLYIAGLQTFVAGRKAVDDAALTRALGESEDAVVEVMNAAVVATYAAAYTKFKPLNKQIYAIGGHSAYGSIPFVRAAMRFAKDEKKKKSNRAEKTVRTSFDMLDQDAVDWVEDHALELAKNLSETSRKDIRAAVHRAFVETGDPIQARREIMQSIGSASRAEVISRTEIMTAQNEGKRAGWRQAADDELIAPDARRIWITSGSACKECLPMNDAEATLNGTYDNRSMGPPLHPNCRCTEGLV